jgi:hypothetical protein
VSEVERQRKNQDQNGQASGKGQKRVGCYDLGPKYRNKIKSLQRHFWQMATVPLPITFKNPENFPNRLQLLEKMKSWVKSRPKKGKAKSTCGAD